MTPTLGIDYIGVVVTAILYGVTTTQTLFYYRTYTKDRTSLKLMVSALWILDTVSLIFNAHGLYTWLVVDFTNIEAVATIPWSLKADSLVTATIGLIVNVFLMYRIWALRRKWWPVIIIMMLWALTIYAIAIFVAWVFATDTLSLSGATSAASDFHVSSFTSLLHLLDCYSKRSGQQ